MLALASYTGWSEQEMLSMRTSRLLQYLQRLPKSDGK
jgi:hypothetical protein